MNVISSTCFDSIGNPCDFEDEDGITWVYLGKRHGFDEWQGVLKED